MKRHAKVDSREAGLRIGLLLGRHIFKTEDLHYGYWPDDLEVDLRNLPEAQEHHSAFIMSHIPEGVKTVLDVGCGVGNFAKKLIDEGYEVEGVSPSPMLAEHARARLGDAFPIFECRFEDLETDKTYDLVLFSESFQYVNLAAALDKVHAMLNPGGHLLICDFFGTGAEGKSALKGGHMLSTFRDTMASRPFEEVKDIDITKQTAPNLDLVDELLMQVGRPTWQTIIAMLETRHPLLSRLLKWKFKKKLKDIDTRYFGGERNGANFAKYKSYRLYLFKKA
jgi:SAM-dependent methyltransferase